MQLIPKSPGRPICQRFWCLVFCLAFAPCASQARGNDDGLSLIVKFVSDASDVNVRRDLLAGMLKGLEGRRDVPPPNGWKVLAKQLADSEDSKLRELSNRLSQIFGDQQATENALALLRSNESSIPQKRSALQSLVAQRRPDLGPELRRLFNLMPLRADVVRAYGVLGIPGGATIILDQYDDQPVEIKRTMIETLATRREYARTLAAAIGSGAVPREDIPSYIARSLRDVLGKTFVDAYGEVPELKEQVATTIAKYKRLITDPQLAKASAGRGRAVFEKTCGACHLMYGQGGKVGPDLTGSNRTNLDYLLLNSVAPSADVPEGYRTHLIQTNDGRILNGVLAEEDVRRVVLKTVDQPRVVIAKDDIEARKVSKKSIMPEGQLEQLSKQQLFDLVKYMQTRSQVEAIR